MALAIIPASILIAVTGFVFAARLHLRGAMERLAGALLLAIAALTGELLIAGVLLQSLMPLLVLAIAAIGFLATIALTGFHRRGPWRAAWAQLRADIEGCLRFLRRHWALAILAAAVALALAWRAVLALRLPIHDFDGFAYHLVTVDVWLQSGHIGRVPQRLWSDAYPSNGEIVTLWLKLFSNTDGLAGLTGLVGLPLGGIAITGFARELGATRMWAGFAGLVVLAMPAVILKADSTYIDNLGIAEVAAAWLFGLRAIRATKPSRRLALSLLTGIAIGLAAGTKASLVVPLAGIGIALFVSSIVRASRTASRPAGLEIVAIAIPVLALGGSWYIKNLVVFGNPLWPFTIGPLVGLGSFEAVGLRTPADLLGMTRWEQIATSWLADFRYRSYADAPVGGFGLAWTVVLGLAMVGAIWLARRRALLILAAIVLPVLLALAVMPMPFWPRYTLFFVVLVVALAAATLSAIPRRAARVLGLAIGSLALISLGIAHQTANFQIRPGGPFRPSVVRLAQLVVAGEDRRRDIWLWEECRGFETVPSGARVRSDGFQLPHLIVGPALDRELLVPFPAGVEPRAAISWDGVAATYMVLSDARDVAAARADAATFEALGPVCRGAELFAVRSR